MSGIPSRTAWRVAVRRAEHQALDRPPVFEDPLALRIVGGELAADRNESPLIASMFRAFMAARSRYAEDHLAAAVLQGVRQYVILGAGLDTFAYRNPCPGLRVFEVDREATQNWKIQLLTRAEIPIPDSLIFVAVDFETQNLRDRLFEAGMRSERTFFSWLGVTPYLTSAAFAETMRFIASMPAGSGVAFDYVMSPELLDPELQTGLRALADRVEKAGEPFRLYFDPAQLAIDVRAMGFHFVEDLGSREIDARYFAGRADGLRLRRGAGRLFMCKT